VGLAALSATAAVQEWIALPPARRASRTVAAALVVATAVCLVLLAWLLGPTASAQVTWLLD